MKKTLIIAGVLVFLLLAAVIAVPVIFKKPLLEKTKATINNQINATVDFSGFSLSLIRHFPQVTLELKNVTILGSGSFEGDTLMAIPAFRTRFSVASLFSKSGMALEELILKSPYINLVVDSLGNANWDIMKESETTISSSEVSSSEKNTFEIQLEKIEISNATIIYTDIAMPMLLSLRETDINLKGKMYGSSTELSGSAAAGRFLLNYDSVTYISNSTLKTNTVFNIDFDQLNFTIKESGWWLNQLPFELNGDFRMPNDSMFFNLDFKAKRTGLGDFLALTPPDYEKFMKDVETEGSADLKGYFKGLYFEEDYPAFSFDFNIANGRIKYTSLPEEIRNISADVKIWKPQGDLDLMELRVKNTHAEIAGNPIDLTANISKIYSDMNFEFGLKGKFNFTQLKKALPLDNLMLDGNIDANIYTSGKYSDVESKKYENIKSDGKVIFSDLSYTATGWTQPVKVPTGVLEFSPSEMTLSNLKILAGKSDLAVAGKISNYLPYFLRDDVLSGDIKIISEYIDFSELMTMAPATTDTAAQKQTAGSPDPKTVKNELTAVTIPANYDFKINATVLKSGYEQLPLSNIRLAAAVKEGRISVANFSAIAGGSDIKMNGYYGKGAAKSPMFAVNGTLRSIDIATFYNALPALKESIPQAGNASGKADMQFKAEGEYGAEIKMNVLAGSASLTNFKYVDPELTQPVYIQKGNIDFNLAEINLSQLNVKVGESDMSLTGKLSNFLDYYNSKGILEGSLQMKSGFLNVNELMNLQVAEKKPEGAIVQSSGSELKAFTVPADLKLTFNTSIAKALYTKINISNIEGQATVSDGKLNLQGLTMKMLDGELKLNGSYTGNAQNQPDVDLGFAIVGFDLPSAFNLLSFFQEKIPVAKHGQGKFSTSFTMKGKLTPDLKIDYPSINGNGLFNTINFQLIDAKVFEQLSGIIKNENLKNLKFDNFTSQFTIENGNIALKPFQTKIAGQDVKMTGNLNAQNLVNMKLDFNIQRNAFGSEVQKLLAVLPGQERIQIIPASVTINGPVKEPAVSFNLDDAKKMIADEAKKSATDELKNQIDRIGNLLKK